MNSVFKSQKLEELIMSLKVRGISLHDIANKLGYDRQHLVNIRRLKDVDKQEDLYIQIKTAFDDVLQVVDNLPSRMSVQILQKEIEFLKVQNEQYVKEIQQLREEKDKLLNKLLDKL